MQYLPFEITEYNDVRDDMKVILNSDTGTVWVRIGKLDIEIKQTDDGQGVIINALDAELCAQDLGSMTVLYDDIEELPNDGEYPIH
jgi:hypothetical protein